MNPGRDHGAEKSVSCVTSNSNEHMPSFSASHHLAHYIVVNSINLGSILLANSWHSPNTPLHCIGDRWTFIGDINYHRRRDYSSNEAST
jgi:hypothetical protein